MEFSNNEHIIGIIFSYETQVVEVQTVSKSTAHQREGTFLVAEMWTWGLLAFIHDLWSIYSSIPKRIYKLDKNMDDFLFIFS